MTLTVSQTVRIPNTPVGTRLIFELSDVLWTANASEPGYLVSPRPTGWLSALKAPARSMPASPLRTPDGAVIFVQLVGRIDLSKGPAGASSYLAARFETGDSDMRAESTFGYRQGQSRGDSVVLELFEPR